MADIAKVLGILIASAAKVMGIAGAKIMGLCIPALGGQQFGTGLIFLADTVPATSTLTAEAGVVDGDKSTRVGSYIGYPDAWGIDFGTTIAISQFLIYLSTPSTTPTAWYGSEWDSFRVYDSADNAAWTLIKTIDAPAIVSDGGYLFHVILDLDAPESKRYFKVVADSGGLATDPGSQNSYFCELEAYS